MTCKNKNNDIKNKNKKIVCKKCECKYDKDNNFSVTCIECEDGNDKTIVCKSCNCINNDEENKKEICLKGCKDCDDTIYISCTEYTEDLD